MYPDTGSLRALIIFGRNAKVFLKDKHFSYLFLSAMADTLVLVVSAMTDTSFLLIKQCEKAARLHLLLKEE